MKATLCALMLLALGACCTIGPNDHPGGVVKYLDECQQFIRGR